MSTSARTQTYGSGSQSGSMAGDRSPDAGITGSVSRGTSEYSGSSSGLGSARSDYGSQAYGGTLDKTGRGGAGIDQFGTRAGRGRGQMINRGMGMMRGLGPDANSVLMFALGAGVGAGLMYYFDPEGGRRRRALLRDKVTKISNRTVDTVESTSRDLRNRAQGVVAETGSALGLTGGGESESKQEPPQPQRQQRAGRSS
jgi:hypothetical protein